MRQLVILLIIALVFSCGEHRRIQEPNEIFPYEVEEVNISTADKLTLSGTLTSPLKDTLKTAVILIGGSGPSDRDYKNRFGHRPFLVLSHHLTQ